MGRAKPVSAAKDLDAFALAMPEATYAAVLMRIPDLDRLDRDELSDLVEEAWLTRVQKRVAKAWLAERGEPDEN
jgi:hypothetical protein